MRSASVPEPSVRTTTFTVRYYDALIPEAAACLQRLDFTVEVEVGDPVTDTLGYTEGPTGRSFPFRRLRPRGDLLGGAPIVGLSWPCSSTSALVPVVAELRVENDLRVRPSPRSALVRLELPDPCAGRNAAARGPGAGLRFTTGGQETGEGERELAVEHRRKQGGRYALRVTQGARLVGQLRYYVAFRPQNGGKPRLWVIAPEAAFSRARCHTPPNDSPLGFRPFPIPACPADSGDAPGDVAGVTHRGSG